MQFLHTMVRVSNLEKSLEFYCEHLGLKEAHRFDSEQGRFTLVFLVTEEDFQSTVERIGSASDIRPAIELTYNWDAEEYTGGRNFGHLAYAVNDLYTLCQKLMDAGVTINRPPRDGHMAFVRSPDNISIELLQRGDALEVQEPWVSMPNTGTW